MVLVVTPALFSLNMLISRLVAGWLPPVNLTFWRWFLTALFAGALVFPQIQKSLPILRREWPRLLLLGSIGMSLCGLSAYQAGHTTSTANIALIYASSPGLPLTPKSLAMLALIVVVASYASYVAYALLQRMSSISFAGLAVYVSPFYAAFYGWLFVNESLQGFHLIGAAMVLARVWLASRHAGEREELLPS